jgi:transposase
VKAELREIAPEEIAALLERARSGPLSAEDILLIEQMRDTLALLTREIQRQDASIQRLRQWLGGFKTEKTKQVFDTSPARARKRSKAKRKGHGRNGAAAYTGAPRIEVPHGSLHHGDRCPHCQKGKVYREKEPTVLVRIRGLAPLSGKVYECEELRCNLCGEVFTAEAPAGVGEQKYDETATAMIAELKYDAGLPFNRIEKLQDAAGIPLPAATQWDLVKQGADKCAPAHQELIRQAAQGELLHNDDTGMRVLDLTQQARQEVLAAAGSKDADERTGTFTSGIVSVGGNHKIALFFTGPKHAGENLADVLARRATELKAPIQMCDCSSKNTCGAFKSILAACLSHARRKYVDVAPRFPNECRFILETLGDVYQMDAIARVTAMTPWERLRFHQQMSGPLMVAIEDWMRQQLDEHRIEPNSGLGEAIRYMQNHWSKLTLFLRQAGAPLDNNICERVLKKAILHRKNALFYKTLAGARVGDIFMSLIHTAHLNGEKALDYLVALLRNHEAVAQRPAEWMPWNYRATLELMSQPGALCPAA